MTAHSALISENTPEAEILPTLSGLGTADLLENLPTLLSWLGYPVIRRPRNLSSRTTQAIDAHLFACLAVEPAPTNPLVVATERLIAAPSLTHEAAHLKTALVTTANDMLSMLPKTHLELYRDALTRLRTTPTPAEQTVYLAPCAADFLRFLDAPGAYVPTHKTDALAYRTLALVRSADEMRPLVPRLVRWCQDPSWPPLPRCFAVLKRFPELAVEEIRGVLREGTDGQWEYHLLGFLARDVRPALWAGARADIERIAQRPTDDELDNEAHEEAMECLRVLQDWVDRAKFSR